MTILYHKSATQFNRDPAGQTIFAARRQTNYSHLNSPSTSIERLAAEMLEAENDPDKYKQITKPPPSGTTSDEVGKVPSDLPPLGDDSATAP